jgi:hypothetical protein
VLSVPTRTAPGIHFSCSKYSGPRLRFGPGRESKRSLDFLHFQHRVLEPVSIDFRFPPRAPAGGAWFPAQPKSVSRSRVPGQVSWFLGLKATARHQVSLPWPIFLLPALVQNFILCLAGLGFLPSSTSFWSPALAAASLSFFSVISSASGSVCCCSPWLVWCLNPDLRSMWTVLRWSALIFLI